MSQTIVHSMDSAWTSSNPALLSVSADAQVVISGAASNRIASSAGAQSVFAEFVPATPLDLSSFDELRFWLRASPTAAGSRTRPFFLEFSYVDQNDAPGEVHEWFVAVNHQNTWEQRRIGVENERRSAINRLRFTCLLNTPFACYIDELLAVREEMLADVEQALFARLEQQLALPGLANIAIDQNAAQGTTQIRLPLTHGFNAGNRILIQGGGAGDELHDVIAVQNDTIANHTTLSFAAADALRGNLTAGVATVTVTVPVMIETPAAPQSFDATPPSAPLRPTPALLLSLLDAREDLTRTNYEIQRDSFRQRGSLLICSVRAPARAYFVDYQIMPLAPDRAQELFLRDLVVQRLSMDIPLRINGAFSSVYIRPPPELIFRQIGQPTSVYLRIYTRLETASRLEQIGVRRLAIDAAPPDAPLDEEEMTVDL